MNNAKGILENLCKGIGCKESQFYGFPFRQVVASMYQPKSLLSSPQKILMSSIDYSSSVIWISPKNSLVLQAR